MLSQMCRQKAKVNTDVSLSIWVARAVSVAKGRVLVRRFSDVVATDRLLLLLLSLSSRFLRFARKEECVLRGRELCCVKSSFPFGIQNPILSPLFVLYKEKSLSLERLEHTKIVTERERE